MDSLYELANISARRLDPRKQDKQDANKISQLEQSLREDVIDSKTKQTAELAGNASMPTAKQAAQIRRLDIHEGDAFNNRQLKLGDYTNLIRQMKEDQSRATQQMFVSTLASQKETAKLTDGDNEFAYLSSQFGLDVRSNRSFKNAKKLPLMSAQNTL
jgi:hypothetical protein